PISSKDAWEPETTPGPPPQQEARRGRYLQGTATAARDARGERSVSSRGAARHAGAAVDGCPGRRPGPTAGTTAPLPPAGHAEGGGAVPTARRRALVE